MKRVPYIDYMRTGALFLIILAHVNAPEWLMELRNFDVVMLVFLSGLSYQISANNHTISFKSYLWKRTKKLLFPTWIVLTCIFGVTFCITRSFEPYTLVKVIESYLLYDGIGYVWFVRITLILAIFSPIMCKISKYTDNNLKRFIGVLSLWLIIYITMLEIYNASESVLSYWVRLVYYLYPLYLFGYGIIFFLGIKWIFLTVRMKIWLLICCTSIFVIGRFIMDIKISDNKYPPGLVYLTYGIIWVAVITLIMERMNLSNCPKVIAFISKNSFMIYLMHIIPILMVKYIKNNMFAVIRSNFIIEYLFLISVTAVLLGCQIILKRLIKTIRGSLS